MVGLKQQPEQVGGAVVAMVLVGHRPEVVRHSPQRHCRLTSCCFVMPQAGVWLEPVLGEERRTAVGDDVHDFDDVVERCTVDEVADGGHTAQRRSSRREPGCRRGH